MWLLANKLTLNVNKTEYMLIGSRQGLSTQVSVLIKRVSSTKTLGVVVDEWDTIDRPSAKQHLRFYVNL